MGTPGGEGEDGRGCREVFLSSDFCICDRFSVREEPWPLSLFLWLVLAQEGPCFLELARGSWCFLYMSLAFSW